MTAEMSADARTWLDYALEDRGWAEYNSVGGYYAQACFACQQSIEKLLKAFLLAYNMVPPRIHALVQLLSLCAEQNLEVSRFEGTVRILDQYYVATRYPDLALGRRPYTEEEAREALTLVDSILNTLVPIIEDRIAGRD